ncbi:2-hydroxyacid dehydrogenase [Planococcus halotolerans]|uniref:2-hydroxyacid dehydrogenase n=1 Tax=Planococcus halotolerans TaxID=2233542 RepID=UPI0010918EDA|nr:D-glycerate dehydrogenase [Planococcus halotolerans]QHJ70125.1 bifunctional glyoxylate/hydroxypyruvate reductase B [Planococcus halotolerans]
MKPKVLVYNSISNKLLDELANHCTILQSNPRDSVFQEHLFSAEAIFGSSLKVDKELLDRAPNLKLVVNISAGYDNLDVDELSARGILATNTPDVLVETTADMVFGLLLSTARRIPELDQYVKTGEWKGKVPDDMFGIDVNRKTLGIIGMGSIGKAVAERAHHGFKMNILYHNRSKNPIAEAELNAQYETLENLLKKSDFVCLMAPLTPETIGMIGKNEFALMKRSAIFVNGARGQMVKEAELIEALEKGEILAAGLDVYLQEPLSLDSPLLSMKNVLTTPHVASGTHETRYKMAELAIENLIKGLKGETPPCLINPEVINGFKFKI